MDKLNGIKRSAAKVFKQKKHCGHSSSLTPSCRQRFFWTRSSMSYSYLVSHSWFASSGKPDARVEVYRNNLLISSTKSFLFFKEVKATGAFTQ